MGGIIIIACILIPSLLFCKLNNVYVILMLISTIWMGAIGFLDDYIKVFKKDKEGLKGRFKVIGQIGLGIIIGTVLFFNKNVVVRVEPEIAKQNKYEVVKTVTELDEIKGGVKTWAYVKAPLTNVPFMKGNELNYGYFLPFIKENANNWAWIIFIPFVILIVISVSNAANMTDGIDGLAAGTSAVIGGALGIFAYVSGNSVFSQYLNILYIPDSGELFIFTACFIGACIGFLWYNTFPAQVFMGDTGSLTLGALIAAIAIILRKELLIPVFCGIFVVENLSVVLQVMVFKYRKRKYGLEYAQQNRLFKMAPLHHHYQKSNIHESKIVMRFIIVGIVLAVISVVTLKIR
ncbi:MAG: phospho-N-acetylmuramoyl-pentapeptide-transferase [Bacteroidota bacterium]|jgi:phospho-N-acetylmuramoyl-pentapeptide-transferase